MKDMVTTLVTGLLEVWGEMFAVLMKIIPKVIGLILWIFCGIIILPCVFVTSNIYPAWLEWQGIKN
jgi:hypothetical protein